MKNILHHVSMKTSSIFFVQTGAGRDHYTSSSPS